MTRMSVAAGVYSIGSFKRAIHFAALLHACRLTLRSDQQTSAGSGSNFNSKMLDLVTEGYDNTASIFNTDLAYTIYDLKGKVGERKEASRGDDEHVANFLDAIRDGTPTDENIEEGHKIALLADQKITVSAGHCNPSLDELRAAINNGLSMFTHLGNGCPLILHRHDNIIQQS